MSEVDKENVQIEERQRLVNHSGQENSQVQNQSKSRKKKILIGVGILVVIGVILAIVLPLTLKKKHDEDNVNPFDIQEYNPYSVDPDTWNFSVYKGEFVMKTREPIPTPPDSKFMSLMEEGIATVTNKDYKPVNPKNIPIGQWNNVGTDQVKFNIDMVDNFNVRLLIQDNLNLGRNLVSEDVFPRPVLSWEARLTQVGFQTANDPFSLSFSNIYTKNTIISTEKRKLFVSDKFSEIGFVLPTQRCYGLGQRNSQFQLQHGTYTLHSRFRKEGLPVDDSLGGKNGNHIHPFIMCQSTDKDFFGMFFVSSAPQTFELIQFGGEKRMVLNYITLGGPIEIYTIMRGKPEEIISKYHTMIGYSAMPPYHALGFYQGSNTYNTLDKVKNVVQNFQDSSIALEGIFLTNYNQQPHQTFTISDQFKGLTEYVTKLHGGNQRIILGASLAIQGNYDIFQISIKHKCLVDSIQKGKQVIGILDMAQVFYIDPFHDGTQPFFEETLPAFYKTVGSFDGIQIQDAHLPNHISGEVDQSPPEPETFEKRMLLSEESIGSYEPYKINQDQSEPSLWNLPFEPLPESLYYLTIPLNGSQGGGDTSPKILNFYVHNANSHRTLQKINAAWEKLDEESNTRPLLFSDSSWVGSGAYGIALLTDMQRTWTNLRGLIAQAMGLSLFGMSNTMVDSCGSLGKMDEELCARWMQVSAFLPMFRGYYNETYLDTSDDTRKPTDPSEFWNFKDFDYQAAYTGAISQRLPYTRYIYSQLYYAYRVGAALVKPMFYDYPEDDKAFQNPEHTFMLGDSIKVSPVLDKGLKDGDYYPVYFPQGLWYDLNDPKSIVDTTKGGDYVNIQASNTQTNIHLKGGKIIPFQKNIGSQRTTRDFETKIKMSFKIARDEALKHAEGYVLIDDGISADSYSIGAENKQKFTYWKLRYAEKSINFWVEHGDFSYEPPEGYQIHYMQNIDILNAEDLQDTDFACYLGLNLQPTKLDIDYNPFTKVLTLQPTKANPNVKFNDIGFIKFGSAAQGDQNFCDPSSFQYNTDDAVTTDPHEWIYKLSSTSQGLKPLIAVFQQLDDIGTINLEITTQEDYDAGKTIIYRVPEKIVYDTETHFPKKADLKRKLSDFLKVKERPFQYSLYKDTLDENTKVWSSDPTRLYFSEFFVMDSGVFDMNPDVDQPLMGMGERAGSLFYKNEKGGIHSRYTFDQANPIDDGLPPGRNMYGYQPFYAFQSAIKNTNDWFGVFDVSSYATDYIVFSSNENKQTQIHKITIGGTINKFFFIGAKPDDIIKTYSKLVGFPTVPPLWAFGWHQCRFGWITDDDWWNVYQQYKANDLPLDTMWADIDYMDDYKLFTISQQSYPDLPQKVDEIKKDGLTFVPIMDAGVAVRENQGYTALDLGLEKNVFIKQANKKDPLTAGVWCGNAYFPDFFKPETVEWWKDMFTDLHDKQGLHFDGIWLDENEATNFCNGYCKPEERPADSLRNKPFYVPGWRDLEDKALGVDGWHDSIERYEYDVHNLYPLMQTKATAEFLISQKKRPYILTRANYPGIGKYGHHWMGDNWSTIEYMKISVDGIYSYNLFALPFMGSDICGFNGDAAPDLCTRWHILGSLYPFARNHNQNASASQEPYVFNQTVPGTTNTKYVDIIRNALINRYSFIKYYYSAFYMLAQEGGSFFKPLFYEYPQDKKAFIDIEVNILLGDALKLSMETTTLDFKTYPSRQYYFPKDRWCRILPPIEDVKNDCFESKGDADGYQTFPSTLDSYYIHMRNGYILPYQDAQANKVRKTLDLESFPTDLYILPVQDNVPMTLSKTVPAVARGFVIFDDGVAPLPNPFAKFEFYMVKGASDTLFTITFNKVGDLTKGNEPKEHENLGDIHIMWASKSGLDKIKEVRINYGDKQSAVLSYKLDAKTDILTIEVTSDKQSHLFWDITEIVIE